jgi:ribonuclease PH
MIDRVSKSESVPRRADGRTYHAMRPCEIVPGFISSALGSVLISTGRTRVICTVSVEARAPSWLRSGGWLTAEYAMLPGATNSRTKRGPAGRSQEISRLIGRALRSSLDLGKLVSREGGLTLTCDCDVIEADGGTRTASITGAFVALRHAVRKLQAQGILLEDPVVAPVAAVSVGLVASYEAPLLDLDYSEDSDATVDFNVVARGGSSPGLIEVQGTGENGVFSREQLDLMLDLASVGIREHFVRQEAALNEVFS